MVHFEDLIFPVGVACVGLLLLKTCDSSIAGKTRAHEWRITCAKIVNSVDDPRCNSKSPLEKEQE